MTEEMQPTSGPSSQESDRRSAPPAASGASRSRSRRWLRRLFIAGLFSLGALGLGLWIVTRSWFIIAQIKPELEAKLGGPVSIANATYEGRGRFVFRDISLRSPAHLGTAGDILWVEHARVDVVTRRLWRGEIELEAVRLDGVVLRFSEDMHDPGSFAFMALSPSWDPGARIATLPRVEIRRATVEYGAYATDPEQGYVVHGIRHLAGDMRPGAEPSVYSVRLREIDQAGYYIDDGFVVDGTWDVATNEHQAQIDGLLLDEKTLAMCPQTVRFWWERMDLAGRVSDARISWEPEQPLRVSFSIEEVELTLPIETEDLWARYHGGQVVGHSARPRMRAESGEMILENDSLELDLVGELGSEDVEAGEYAADASAVRVPYKVKVRISNLPPMDWDDREGWMDRVLLTAPFEMVFVMDNFRIAPDEHGDLPPVDLPLRIATVLERFLLTDWSLSTVVEVTRAPPRLDEFGKLMPEPVRTYGVVSIQEASGSYDQFPYRLQNVESEIEFDNDVIRLKSIEGTAPNGSLVNIHGTISPVGRDAEVNVYIRANDVDVDEHLRAALRFHDVTIFDSLMHGDSVASLQAAGLLDGLFHDLDERPLGGGPFELGGRANLDLRVHRAHGPDQPTDIFGSIEVKELGMVYEHFPYPFVVGRGTLTLDSDGVRIEEDENGNGLPVASAGGGRGNINGRITRKRIGDEWRTLPDLTLHVVGDSMNDLLYAAIPLSDREREALGGTEVPIGSWPGGLVSDSAILLKSAGLVGTTEYEGRIFGDESGEIRYEFGVRFQGEANPGEELAAKLSEAGLIWPSDLVISDVEATARITADMIELLAFDGLHEHGGLRATGAIDWQSDETLMRLDIDLHDLVLGRYLIDLVPHEGAEIVVRLWDRYQPSGVFNARLEFRAVGDHVEPPRLLVDPSRAQVVIEDEPFVLQRDSGMLVVSGGRVTFDGLSVDLQRGEEGLNDGRVRLSGSYGLTADAEDLVVAGEWLNGRLDSPIITEAMRLIGAEEHVRNVRQFDPRGSFDAEFKYASPRDDQPRSYELVARPRAVELTIGETQFDAELHAESQISFVDDLITLHDVRGVLGGDGSTFELAGSVYTGALLSIDLDRVEFDGPLMGAQLQALLPSAVRDLLKQIEFADGPRTQVQNGAIRLQQFDPEDFGKWRSRFAGDLRTHGAAFTAGVQVRAFDGLVSMSIEDDGEDHPRRVRLDVEAESLIALDRRLTNLRADGITISTDGKSLILKEVRADCYGGLLWAEAEIGLHDGAAYEARLELVGASVAGLVTGDPEHRPRRASNRIVRHGKAYGGVRFSGVVGKPELRTGRGVLRAVGDNLESVPVVLHLMQLLQLSLPLRGEFDKAHLEFFIDGDEAVFERILLESTFADFANLQLLGEGEMNLSTLEIRTQFRTRGAMLLVRELVGTLGDQLYAIEITGTLQNPRARLVPLPGLAPQAARSANRSAAVGDTP